MTSTENNFNCTHAEGPCNDGCLATYSGITHEINMGIESINGEQVAIFTLASTDNHGNLYRNHLNKNTISLNANTPQKPFTKYKLLIWNCITDYKRKNAVNRVLGTVCQIIKDNFNLPTKTIGYMPNGGTGTKISKTDISIYGNINSENNTINYISNFNLNYFEQIAKKLLSCNRIANYNFSYKTIKKENIPENFRKNTGHIIITDGNLVNGSLNDFMDKRLTEPIAFHYGNSGKFPRNYKKANIIVLNNNIIEYNIFDEKTNKYNNNFYKLTNIILHELTHELIKYEHCSNNTNCIFIDKINDSFKYYKSNPWKHKNEIEGIKKAFGVKQ